MSETKPKRQMTADMLEKLGLARQKALEVRRKKAMITKADKLEKAKILDENYRKVIGQKDAEPSEVKNEPTQQPEEITPLQEPKKDIAELRKGKKSKVKNVVVVDSDESSSNSSSDDEYDFSAVKNRYREKYKTKYEAKYGGMQHNIPHNPYATTPYQDAFTIAKQNLQGKLSNEVKKLAYSSLFGSS